MEKNLAEFYSQGYTQEKFLAYYKRRHTQEYVAVCSQYPEPGATAQGPINREVAYYTAKKIPNKAAVIDE